MKNDLVEVCRSITPFVRRPIFLRRALLVLRERREMDAPAVTTHPPLRTPTHCCTG